MDCWMRKRLKVARTLRVQEGGSGLELRLQAESGGLRQLQESG